KGATAELIAMLDQGLAHYAAKVKDYLAVDVKDIPGAGAAGGIGAGLVAFLNAQLVPGVELVIEATGMEELAKEADLVITGEGRTDRQTAFGKAPVGVAKIAKNYNKPVVCISGGLSEGWEDILAQGIDAVFSICNAPISLEEAMANATGLLESASGQVARIWQAAKE
ncbi:MAG: glycerate kinase, partial [Bacillota bacterium]|nr:glycerate kinase [Bacillota bacterium]